MIWRRAASPCLARLQARPDCGEKVVEPRAEGEEHHQNDNRDPNEDHGVFDQPLSLLAPGCSSAQDYRFPLPSHLLQASCAPDSSC